MPARLVVQSDATGHASSDALLLIGRGPRLLEDDVAALIPPSVGEAVWRQMVRKTDGGDSGRVATTWTAGSPSRVSAGVLPEPCSRHNSPSRALAIPGLVGAGGNKGNTSVVLCVDEAAHAAAAVMAVARALPTYAAGSTPIDREVRVQVLPRDGGEIDVPRLTIAADAVRRAAHWVDEPPDVLGCDALVDHAREVAARTGTAFTVIRGDALRDQGLGGLHAVGRAAEQPPALCVLDHHPAGARRTVAWVGKGIVFDTGGLSIKAKTSMPGMKTDMAGAAAVLAAFEAAVRLGVPDRLVAVLCVAENAVGPRALRPDDVITMLSGKTVEVNNADAEGRLVLSDGVAWVARHADPDEIVDLATLTGAQSIATGKRHAAIVSTDEALELRALQAGRHSGDLVHPLPWAPELFRREFASPIADMRNSVKDRNNAQSSCAAQFIHNHLAAIGWARPWLHVDMAAPAVATRATGYGVGLLLALEGLI